ncbi:2'-5' RNA ligase family protein [Umezawaea beigongshangensis]|uniref:2'-5' RNA ligase family protein n=1 Tax=Umezawaea beigongshangensis TaxID=2780383 RepID=UPI0018F1CB76|nr:2'-5' RNA ligase family protein [Umezawaea beigongshangensis]
MRSVPDDTIGRDAVGYLVNAALSPAAQDAVRGLQALLDARLPGALWLAPAHSLHITLLDWIAPLVTYEEDPHRLFERVFPECDRALAAVVAGRSPVEVRFDEVVVSERAIIVRGRDDGSFASIRKAFTAAVELPPGTKPAPRIVHATIARYREAVDLDDLARYAGGIGPGPAETVRSFRLVRENVLPMLAHDHLRDYPLGTTTRR